MWLLGFVAGCVGSADDTGAEADSAPPESPEEPAPAMRPHDAASVRPGSGVADDWITFHGLDRPYVGNTEVDLALAPIGPVLLFDHEHWAGVFEASGAASPAEAIAWSAQGFVAPAGDQDGDGIDDWGLWDRVVSGTLRGDLDAAEPIAHIATGGQLENAGDLDGDGWPDVLAGLHSKRLYPGPVQGDLGDSDALWRMPPDDTNRSPSMMEGTGDLDGDGVGDIVVDHHPEHVPGNPGTCTTSWTLGPVLAAPDVATADLVVEQPTTPSGCISFRDVEDLDGDGLPDVLVRRDWGGWSVESAPWTYGRSAPFLHLTDDDPDRGLAPPLSAGDVDEDGAGDLLIWWLPDAAVPQGLQVLHGPLEGLVVLEPTGTRPDQPSWHYSIPEIRYVGTEGQPYVFLSFGDEVGLLPAHGL